jgi:acyl-CoA thioesterase FadM
MLRENYPLSSSGTFSSINRTGGCCVAQRTRDLFRTVARRSQNCGVPSGILVSKRLLARNSSNSPPAPGTQMYRASEVRFAAAHDFSRNSDCQFVVAGLHLEFAREMLYPRHVSASTFIIAVGHTSYRLGQVLRQATKRCVYAAVVMVCLNNSGPKIVPQTQSLTAAPCDRLTKEGDVSSEFPQTLRVAPRSIPRSRHALM